MKTLLASALLAGALLLAGLSLLGLTTTELPLSNYLKLAGAILALGGTGAYLLRRQRSWWLVALAGWFILALPPLDGHRPATPQVPTHPDPGLA